MSQMTDDMARRIIANWEATKNHYGITAWEECQLAYRWLHHGEAIRAAVAQERERCAKVCEKNSEEAIAQQSGPTDDLTNIMLRHHASQAYSCAAAIRRGE